MKGTSIAISVFILVACSKKAGAVSASNHSPAGTLTANLTRVNPFTFSFKGTATDQDLDPLTYTWHFGEGTTKQGKAEETFSYDANKSFTVKVTISDNKSAPAGLSVPINTNVTPITIDEGKHYQTMEGFGGFGAKDSYWSNGPFTGNDFVNTLINNLGLTILRDNIPSDFEVVNDNNGPYVTDLSTYNLNNCTEGYDRPLGVHLQYLKDMKAAGLTKLITSVWSPLS